MTSQLEQQYLRETLAAAHLLDVILASTGPNELCRQIVHSDFSPDSARSCQLFYLDSKSNFREIASYGKVAVPDRDLTVWDDSPMSQAIRTKTVATGVVEVDGATMLIMAVPLVSNNGPTGLVTLVLENHNLKLEFSIGMIDVFSRIGALYLESLDFGSLSTTPIHEIKGIEDLSPRQLLILGHLDHQLVNLEIAKMLMLSESTIRQETVKIYRALGVSNRAEAASKARSLGLIPSHGLVEAT